VVKARLLSIYGQPVIAIGSPVGLTGSMTWGIISQTSRVQQDPTSKFWVGNLLQTDAPTTHGSSSGPLLNLNGKVVGITTLRVPSTEGPSFLSEPEITIAVSSNTVKKVVDDLIKHGTHKPPYAILKVDGNLVRKKSDLVNSIDNKKPGDSVVLTIRDNNGIWKDFIVKLGQMPEEVVPSSLPHRFGLLGPIMPPTLAVSGLALSPVQDNSTLSICSHVAGTTAIMC